MRFAGKVERGRGDPRRWHVKQQLMFRKIWSNCAADPFSGCLFVFRSRRATAIKLLQYDGQGFILAQKRLSKGRFVWWPSGTGPARVLEAYQAQLLVAAGNPDTQAAPMWRRVS